MEYAGGGGALGGWPWFGGSEWLHRRAVRCRRGRATKKREGEMQRARKGSSSLWMGAELAAESAAVPTLGPW